MDDTPMTITSFVVILLLVIFAVLLACHYLAPHATTWMRSNKEEKIGLSKNKLFHANGYMIHSGSEFLLSTSGSFKRFDTIDRDFKQSGQHPAQRTSPLWNLPQSDQKIPPQPLRPAPAPAHSVQFGANCGKTVTFSIDSEQMPSTSERVFSMQTTQNGNSEDPAHMRQVNEKSVSCLRTIKQLPTPKPIQAPPPPRLSASTSISQLSSAIPRPIAKRHQVPEQKGELSEHVTVDCHVVSEDNKNVHAKQLTRRNSSTNPFLCESIETPLSEQIQPITALLTTKHTGDIQRQTAFLTSTDDSAFTKTSSIQSTNGNNPFVSEVANANCIEVSTKNGPNGVSDISNHKTNGSELAADSTTSAKSLSQNQLFRNRSFSETEASDPALTNFTSKISAVGLKLSQTNNPFANLSQKVKGPKKLQKTLSEDFLFRNIPGAGNLGQGNTTWSFGRSLLRQDSFSSIGRRNSSQVSLDSTSSSMDNINLERAISCDSVNSESSVALSDLELPYTQITGYLCVCLQCDKNSMTSDGVEFIVTVVEAKDVMCPFKVNSFDTFVRIYLVPDQPGAMQTKVVNNTLSPRYDESFTFWLSKQHGRHSLWFHLYHNGSAHTLLGEAEMEICELPRSITTWIPLSDSRKCNAKWGELMFSLSFLPTAERLTIVVVKARNLNLNIRASEDTVMEIQNIFVKVYLMNNEKKVLKKRTSLKRKDRSPIFNDAVIFSLPPHSLTTVQLRLTVFGVMDNASVMPLGHVIVGSCATGKGLRHWHQMLSSLRKPVAMWHLLRQATNQPIFTGGAEAVVAAMRSTAIRTKRNSVF